MNDIFAHRPHVSNGMAARILWALIAGFLVGVFVRSFIPLGWSSLGFVLLLTVAAFALAYLEPKQRTALLVIAVALLAFSGGIARMNAAVLYGDPVLTVRLEQKVVLEGVVSTEPDMRESGVRLSVSATSLTVGSTTVPIHAGILVTVPAHTGISYGDKIRAEGTLQLPEAFDTSDGRQFDYPMFLAKDGILYTLSFARVEVIGGNTGNPVKAGAIWVKQKFLKGLQAALPEPEAGLAGGITVGDKRSIGKELSDTFIRTSLIHVVVLSGYNITLVINMLRRMMVLLPRAIQYGGIAFSVLFIVLMTGGAPSATRAGAMALIAVFARATARTFIAVRILGVVAAAMVMWNPMYLAFDPGFQLSALATLGLVLFTTPIAARLTSVPEKFGLREIISSTLGTQLTVLPLLLYQNGIFSVVALPANLLALVAVPYAMFASFIAAIGGIIAGPFAILIAAPALALLWYILAVAQFFAALPFAAVSVPAFSAWWMFGAYAALFAGYFYYKRKRPGHDPGR